MPAPEGGVEGLAVGIASRELLLGELADAEVLDGHDAATRYARMTALAQHPGLERGATSLLSALARAVDRLEPDDRQELLAFILERIPHDRFARDYVGHLTDVDLARLLVETAVAAGSDPVVLARDVARATGHRAELEELTAVVASGGALAGGTSTVAMSSAAGDPVHQASADDAAARLVATSAEDRRALVGLFPSTSADRRAVALHALRDYLLAEDDHARLEEVVRVWAAQVGAAVEAGEEGPELDALLGVLREVHTAMAEDDPDRAAVLGGRRAAVLAPEVLAELVARARRAGDEGRLRFLGGEVDAAMVDALLDALAAEAQLSRRAALVDVVAGVAAEHLPVVAARLADDRWFVVRNAVTILGRIGREGGGAREARSSEALAAVQRAAGHAHAAVRREVARSLAAAGGAEAVAPLLALGLDTDPAVRAGAVSALDSLAAPDAASALARLAATLPTAAERRRALDSLADHPAPVAVRLLDELASARGLRDRPLRRRARALADDRRSGR